MTNQPGSETGTSGVRQLRLVVTAPDYEAALHFYRDVLGLREQGAPTCEAFAARVPSRSGSAA